jgi:hypothetical protein
MVIAANGYLTEDNLATLRRQGQRYRIGAGREGKAPARWPHGRATPRMHRLLRLPWALRLYARRKTQAERPNAEIKWAMGFRRCALRGIANVRGEWDLVCAGFNLRRLCALGVACASSAPQVRVSDGAARAVGRAMPSSRVTVCRAGFCRPRHDGRAGTERVMLASHPDPRRSLGSHS